VAHPPRFVFVESPKGLWNERAGNEPSRAVPAPKGSARAQQSAMPVIGFLSVRELHEAPELTAAVRQGLKATGFVEGQNIAIEYRFVGNHEERLPALAADLVHREVSVIVATTTPAAVAAKAVTTTFQLSSRWETTRSSSAWLQVSRDPAATSPA